MPAQTKSDGDKVSVRLLDYCMNALDYCIPTRPDITHYWLIKAFQVKRAWTRAFPDKWMHPSALLAQNLALDTVTSALEDPENSVFTSIFMPNEIFHSLGLKPLIAEAVADFIAGAHAELGFTIYAEDQGVPQTYCSFHKVLLGATMAEVFGVSPLIANCSVACDANNITFRMLANRFGVEHVYIDVPGEYDEEGCFYVAEQLREMAEAAQDIYHRPLDEKVLKEKVARSQRTLDNLTRSLRLRVGRYIKNNMGLEMQHGLCFHTLLGEPECERLSRLMIRDYLNAEPFDGVNVVWSSTTPFFCIPLQRLLDVNTDQQLIASDMCFDQVSFTGWNHTADEPYLAMAERLIRDSYNGPGIRRVDRMAEICERAQADGAVCFCHWGCKETMGVSQLMVRELESAGYPTIVIDGDGCDRGNFPGGQAATRLGAFLEMLHAKKDARDAEAFEQELEEALEGVADEMGTGDVR